MTGCWILYLTKLYDMRVFTLKNLKHKLRGFFFGWGEWHIYFLLSKEMAIFEVDFQGTIDNINYP